MASELADAKRRSRDVEEELAATTSAVAAVLKDRGIRPKSGSRSSKPSSGRVLASEPLAEFFVSVAADIGSDVAGR